MTKHIVVAAAALALTCSSVARSQATAQDKLDLEVEKLRTDIRKAEIEVDNAMFTPLRSASGGSASLSSAEKTAEGVLMARASLNGAVGRLTATLASIVTPSPSVRPIVVYGRVPQSVAQWQGFERQKKQVFDLIKEAKGEQSGGQKSLVGGVLIGANIVATILPLIKTDTSMAGAAGFSDEGHVRTALSAALRDAGYDPDLSVLAPADPQATANELMLPLTVQFATLSTAQKTSSAGKAASDAIEKLKTELVSETGGIATAVVIDRQRAMAQQPASRPIIYLLNTDAAVTSTTKKGLFTGLGKDVPAFITSSTIIDFAVVHNKQPTLTTVSCILERRRVTQILPLQNLDARLRPGAKPAATAELCAG